MNADFWVTAENETNYSKVRISQTVEVLQIAQHGVKEDRRDRVSNRHSRGGGQ